MKLFYTGPAINTDMLVTMLEKHGINAEERILDPNSDPEDLNREAQVWVEETGFDTAHQLFYEPKEDEL